ncbi:MAG: FHA domain-containing protein, partial [Bdellovibrionota bacterium]
MKQPVVLRIYKGDQLVGVKQFTESQIVFGRPGEVQVPLDGDRVSTIHAAIEERDGLYFVADLGSETGTFKNGEAVLDTSIETGDILQVGEFRIEFYIGVPKPKAPPTGTQTGVTAAATTSAAPAATPPAAPVQASAPAAKKSADPFEPVDVPADAPAAKKIATEAAKPAVAAKPAAPAAPAKPKEQAKPEAKMSSGIVAPTMTTDVGGGLSQPSSFNLAGPKARGVSPANARRPMEMPKSKGRKTFAPPSRYTNVKEYVKPSKGTVVEVCIAWRERVIATYHFSEKKIVTMGSQPDCDVVLPLLTSSKARKVPIVQIDAVASVLISPEMTGELVRGQTSSSFVELVRQNRMVKNGAIYSIALEQGEMARIDVGDQVSVIVRYVSDSPKPLVAPLLDLTTSEFTGVVLSFVLVSILWLYMFLYTPPKPLDEDLDNDPQRIAMIITPPTPRPPAPPPESAATPAATPAPKVVRSTPAPTKAPEIKAATTKPKDSTNLTTKNDPGASANAAPNKNKTGPKTQTSVKQGGSIKTTDKPASQMQSKSRDVSKSGVFSVFGGGGNNKDLAQSTTGSGELAGMAAAATGKSGYSDDRAGDGFGSPVKDTGQGGTGKALEGIAGGVGTKGRGSGVSGTGMG